MCLVLYHYIIKVIVVSFSHSVWYALFRVYSLLYLSLSLTFLVFAIQVHKRGATNVYPVIHNALQKHCTGGKTAQVVSKQLL